MNATCSVHRVDFDVDFDFDVDLDSDGDVVLVVIALTNRASWSHGDDAFEKANSLLMVGRADDLPEF